MDDRPDTVADTPGPLTARLEPRVLVSGRYQLEAMVGRGGAARVYRALDTALDEIVALKMLHPRPAPGADARALQREVKLARRVTHKNVARTYDIGEHDHDRFLTMEYVDGLPLGALVSNGPLSTSRAVRIALSIGHGLVAAHEAGIIHRDLKPANVLIETTGRVVVTDFGLAWARESSDGKPANPLAGTPVYMAPEQLEGRTDLDGRVDLYALGEILFELLTGRRAWATQNTFPAAALRLGTTPPDPRSLRPDVPSALAQLVLQLMARHREERPLHAVEVVDRLSAVSLESGSSTSLIPGRASRWTLAPRQLAIAVLPLEARVPEDAYLAGGFASDLLDMLSTTEGLCVRPLSMVGALRDVAAEPREVGRRLSVDAIVHGTVERRPDARSVLLTLRLLSVEDGFQLWAGSFTLDAANLFVACDEAARAIGQALATSIVASPRPASTDPAAIDLYLRARQDLAHKAYGHDVDDAVVLLEQALALAPNEPHILSAYAIARSRISHTAEAAELALASAERATRLAPHVADAWLALAHVRLMRAEHAAMIPALGQALSRSPHLAKAHQLIADVMYQVGWTDGAMRSASVALAIDPTLQGPAITLCMVFNLLGESERAEAMLDHPSLALQPMSFVASATRSRIDVWRRRCPAHEGLPDGPAPVQTIARFFHDVATHGAVSDAGIQGLRRLRSLDSPLIVSFVGQIEAEAWARVGEAARALEAIEFADTRGLIDLLWMDRMPLFTEVRKLPRFAPLRRHVEERAAALRRALVDEGWSQDDR
jgi:TolB-like protein/predicted Ser/Thr protein kinase